MGSNPAREKRFESVISTCLVGVFLLIGAGVYLKQFDMDMSRFGVDRGDVKPAGAVLLLEQPEATEGETTLSSLVPYGFEVLSKAEVYNSENLYEKIDGKAPFYIDAGFAKLSTQRFANKADENIWFELYLFDMGTGKNAFSVYSVQKRAEVEPLPPMRFAYKTSNALFFVHGQYYIEMIGSAESEELVKAMAEAARKIRANITVDADTEMTELDLFPPENILKDSIELYSANAFGFEGLSNIFTAKYKFDNKTVMVFLSKRANPEGAEKIAKSYRNFLIENGAAARNAANKNLEGKIVGFEGAVEIVFSTGLFVGGVHEAEDQQMAENLAEKLFNKLTEAAGAAKNDQAK